MRGPGGLIELYSSTIAAANTGDVGVTAPVEGVKALIVEAAFAYGAGGTTCDAYLQTRVKGGTWRDIMNFNFTTAAAKKWSKVSVDIAMAAAVATSDAAMSANTILDGLLGDEIRVKRVSTGTYSGATSLTVTASAKY